MPPAALYAEPITVDDISECFFYHVMDVPGGGVVGYNEVKASFDLRGHEAEYLGHVAFDGRRVLEIGPASGFLTFAMESMGAEVVAVELGEDNEWDVVPHAELDLAAIQNGRQDMLRRLRNGFWWAHARTDSRAKVHYGDVYALPGELGRFDVAVLAAVLLHTREPLRIIEGCAGLSDRIVITEMSYPELGSTAVTRFHPQAGSTKWDTWWDFTPEYLVRFLEVLGFRRFAVTHHTQRLVVPGGEHEIRMFTVVADHGSVS